jgi:hypothetical protein
MKLHQIKVRVVHGLDNALYIVNKIVAPNNDN